MFGMGTGGAASLVPPGSALTELTRSLRIVISYPAKLFDEKYTAIERASSTREPLAKAVSHTDVYRRVDPVAP